MFKITQDQKSDSQLQHADLEHFFVSLNACKILSLKKKFTSLTFI